LKELTGRERLLRSFQGLPVDRRPVSPFIHVNFIRLFFEEQNPELPKNTLDVYRHFGFDVIHRNISVRHEPGIFTGDSWRVEKSWEERDLEVTRIVTPVRTLTQRVRYQWLSPNHQVKAVTESFIKDPSDFEQFRRFRPPLPVLDFTELTRTKALVGDLGIVAPFAFGLFNYVADLRGLDRLLMDFMTDEPFFHELMSYFQAELLDFYGQLTEVGIDAVSYPGNMANGSTVGPGFFRRYVFEYEKKIIDFIQNRGTHVLYHNCGDAKAMIEVYNDIGIHAFETLTEPPYGDMDFREALDRFDPRILLHGGIDQIRFLREASAGEITRAVREKLQLAEKRRGFILGTSDFLEEGTPFENLFAMAAAAG
jgi:uroporphyrinogen-III decarboxylase